MTETKSRRRGTALEHAILDATWAELSEVGYTALTIEAVAKRAGTSKPVIYRRWPSRAHLVIAAWGHQRPVDMRIPDTGSLRADVLWLFTRIARRAGSMMSSAIAGVMGEAFKHPEVVQLLQARLDSAPLTKAISTIVDQAVARGELPPVRLSPRAVRLPLDLVRAEAIMGGGKPVPDEVLEEMVDQIYLPLLRGFTYDPATTSPRAEPPDRSP